MQASLVAAAEVKVDAVITQLYAKAKFKNFEEMLTAFDEVREDKKNMYDNVKKIDNMYDNYVKNRRMPP